MKKALLLSVFFIIFMSIFTTQFSYAKIYNEGEEDEFEINSIKLNTTHEGFDSDGIHQGFSIVSGYLQIKGENFNGQEILFDVNNFDHDNDPDTEALQGLISSEKIGERVIDTASTIKFTFTKNEIKAITGEIMIASANIEISSNNFPNITGIDNVNINVDKNEDLVLFGNDFTQVTTGSAIMIYGRTDTEKIVVGDIEDDNTIKVTGIETPDDKGYQLIKITKETNIDDIDLEIEHFYPNAFRFIGNLLPADAKMYPNTVSKGDKIYFESEKFSLSSNYDVFLIEKGASQNNLKKDNKCEHLDLDEGILTVTVSEDSLIELGNYEVVLTEVLNGEIIAMETIKDVNLENAELSIIDNDFAPTIDRIYPKSGPAIGSEVQIDGYNIITPSIPGLTLNGNTVVFDSPYGTNEEITVSYTDGGIYNDEDVTIKRIISVDIGPAATFQIENGEYKIDVGSPDSLFLNTTEVTDAEKNPYRDVVIQIDTILTTTSGPAIEYKYSQRITEDNGYEYIPSSLRPTIENVMPNIINVDNYNNLNKKTELLIDGENFLVNAYTDAYGTYVNYPIILIKTRNTLALEDYDIKIDPNITVDGVKGVIYDSNGIIRIDNNLSNNPVQLEYEVLDDNDAKVSGIANNEMGTKILFKIPEEVSVNIDDNIKNVQVINPKRYSPESGESDIALDILEFVNTNDVPVIESVEPNIVTVQGGVEVVITGTSFKEGIKVYLDGKEIQGVTRALNAMGTKNTLTFTAAENREVTTQLQIINPSGGIAVAEFIYVDSFEEKPVIDFFNPKKGVAGTFVSIAGDNFLKNDPTVSTSEGIDIYKLIGTRVLFDGEDVNEYNRDANANIILKDYTTPASDADVFKTNNDVLSLANYAEKLILKDEINGVYYKLFKEANGDIKLSNGKENVFIIDYDSEDDKYFADEHEMTFSNSGISLDNGINLKFQTVYEFGSDKIITGKNATVLHKKQILFTVPQISTGRGYKDIVVINPDTKKDEKTDEEGFYYIEQANTNPEIINIDPKKGSIDGGYYIFIEGSDFEETSRVYIDGIEVPKEDTIVSLNNDEIKVKVPECTKNLSEDYGIDELSVPVVIINKDGASANLLDGFTYVISKSMPEIDSIVYTEGSSNGEEIVEIFGYDFRYYEPYKGAYPPTINYDDLSGDGIWNDLLEDDATVKKINSDGNEIIEDADGNKIVIDTDGNEIIDDENTIVHHVESPILPRVYFGEKKAKIVEYAKEYLKVLTPAHEGGVVDVYVVNNDFGVSNKINYTYKQSSPSIKSIVPSMGRYQGQENKDIYGSLFSSDEFRGYSNDDNTEIRKIDELGASVRFGLIDNLNTVIGDENYGRITSDHSTVRLLGGLTVSYKPEENGDDADLNDDQNVLEVTIVQNNEAYTRKFTNYDNSEVYIEAEMLKNGEEYYRPFNYDESDGKTYTNTRYELIKIFVKDRRLFVERGYAPEVTFDNSGHVSIKTPSYYTTDTVTVTYTNKDGGIATASFLYTNPASKPKILEINPNEKKYDGTKMLVFGTIEGKKQIEIIGTDFRDGVRVTINGNDASVVEIVSKEMSDGKTYDAIIAQIPQAQEIDVDKEYSIIVTNEDYGIANSSLDENLLQPLDDSAILPYYFVYKKALSGPSIIEVLPNKTSIVGNNEIKIIGKDFRKDAYVIIGSVGGVPIKPVKEIDDDGSYIIFETPTNLTLGKKDIQVINTDYGVDILNDGIEIISAPTISKLLDENGNVKTRISIEGGEILQIKGENFQDGAEVYFGGNFHENIDDTLNGPTGLYINDKEYIVENGIISQGVEFVDSETLLVTTPVLEDESDFTVVIINKDTGITDNDETISAREPIPADPVNLDAEVVDDRYIKIFGYYSDNVDYYEIFACIYDDNSDDDLIDDNYRDFNYLDITELSSYKIMDIPGVEDMDDDESLYLVLKAVNKYGPSNWSNIVELDYEKDGLEDIDEMGPVDEDSDLGVKDGEEYEEVHNAKEVNINITEENTGYIYIDLSDLSLKNKKTVNIPGKKVKRDINLITLNFKDLWMQFMPVTFYTNEFIKVEHYSKDDAYIRIENEVIDDSYSSLLKGYLPRGTKAISKVNSFKYYALDNKNSLIIDDINGSLEFGMTYDDAYLRVNEKVALYKFDEENYKWIKMDYNLNENNNTLSTRINSSGYYILLKY